VTEQPGEVIWMRPERALAGRPPRHSRAEITAAAIAVADRAGLDAVSMRLVAAELGTGAASLYRYLASRDDLLDLMADAAGGELALAPPTGEWLADLVALGEAMRAVMRRHPWLPVLALNRPVLGPNGLAVMEHYLDVLAGHPAPLAAKLEAFAVLNGMTALSVHSELAGAAAAQRRHAAYLGYAVASGQFPRLAALLGAAAGAGSEVQPDPSDPAARYGDILARVMTGMLQNINIS
jgi:AcrR family transcriptional regulator